MPQPLKCQCGHSVMQHEEWEHPCPTCGKIVKEPLSIGFTDPKPIAEPDGCPFCGRAVPTYIPRCWRCRNPKRL